MLKALDHTPVSTALTNILLKEKKKTKTDLNFKDLFKISDSLVTFKNDFGTSFCGSVG